MNEDAVQAGHIPMKHYVQYHNTDKQGGRPSSEETDFSIFAGKSIKHLLGHRIWLISGESTEKNQKKTFCLEYTFVVDEIEVGTPNVAYGLEGTKFDSPIPLSGLPWFEEFKQRQQNFSLGLREIDAAAVTDLESLAAEHETPEQTALLRAGRVTSSEFLAALKTIECKLTTAQREMLVGHANALDSTLSMGRIARLAGYSGHKTANIQYGRVGALFAQALGVTGLIQKTQILATAFNLHDENGHWQWVMRPAIVEALHQFWPEVIFQSYEEQAAAAEIESDEQCLALKATERAALVLARIGQGAYRRQLIDLWNGRCAVTGCDIEAVLIASHAKPWRGSTNEERLNPYNGLLLAASVDRLFDQGLIAFADDGRIMVCASLTDHQLNNVGLSRSSQLTRVDKKHSEYLRAHCEEVFKANE